MKAIHFLRWMAFLLPAFLTFGCIVWLWFGLSPHVVGIFEQLGQAQYDALIAQFNYYNEQLTALLDAITSGEDVPEQPENPETPENPGEGGEETPAA